MAASAAPVPAPEAAAHGEGQMSSESPAVWYWREGETQHGPITWEKLQSLAECGKIASNDWVFREGWADWKLACEAKDSGVEPMPPPPEPPPLPILPQAVAPPPAVAAVPVPPASIAPVTFQPVPVAVSAALPVPLPPLGGAQMPLPPLAPQDSAGDIGPMPPSPDGVSEGDVNQLRRVLRDGPDQAQPAGTFNFHAAAALAAALTGLMFLAFEMGLVAVGLGGWCLYASSVTGSSNGRNLALTAVGIGLLDVIFRILCATTDLGLTHL
jgi:hypothetical protein